MSIKEQYLLEEILRRLTALENVQNVAFIESVKRKIYQDMEVEDLPAIKLSDLSDVEDTDDAATGKVLKKTATTWQPGTDQTA